jgi:hypothetical protein
MIADAKALSEQNSSNSFDGGRFNYSLNSIFGAVDDVKLDKDAEGSMF